MLLDFMVLQRILSQMIMLVMQYASEGDLHKYLQKKFTEITWNKDKLRILYQISEGYFFIFKYNFYIAQTFIHY